VSVRRGESFRLFVSTTAAGFYAAAYRMGGTAGDAGVRSGVLITSPVIARPLRQSLRR
jgi:hypothetical protein